jgi:hypothetical protein
MIRFSFYKNKIYFREESCQRNEMKSRKCKRLVFVIVHVIEEGNLNKGRGKSEQRK